MERTVVSVVIVLAILTAANGIFMLSSPLTWFTAVPGVTRTGMFNQHFIRDIGIMFVFVGVGLAYGAVNIHYRVIAWGVASAWLASHAIFHYMEVLTGICSPAYLITDFPAVTLPAVIGILATAYAVHSSRRQLLS